MTDNADRELAEMGRKYLDMCYHLGKSTELNVEQGKTISTLRAELEREKANTSACRVEILDWMSTAGTLRDQIRDLEGKLKGRKR